MIKTMENYSRFYAIFNRLPYKGDREEFKKSVVLQYTWNRTEHLHEMTEREYNDCCAGMEKMIPGGETAGREAWREELRRQRSICLKLMQQLGIDTTNWNRVNAFCQDGRIAGKVFRELDSEELAVLSKKLRSIQRKGGLRELPEPGETAKVVNLHQ
ncbi:MAG: hypothetical protein IJT98_10580 [Prevotella sp.]|nr:hypothetical protein [Prevotella sp.]